MSAAFHQLSRILIPGGVLLLLLAPADAEVVATFAEGPGLEFSGDSDTPTPLGALGIGRTVVSGEVTDIGDFLGGFNGTADIFSFEVAAGTHLQSITLDDYVSETGGMFLALDQGPTFHFWDFEINDSPLPDLSLILGGTVAGHSQIGTDILDDLASAHAIPVVPPQGREFATPLPAGTYSVYIQETGPNSQYALSFNVTAVPEPSSAALLSLAGGLVGCGLLARRRRESPVA